MNREVTDEAAQPHVIAGEVVDAHLEQAQRRALAGGAPPFAAQPIGERLRAGDAGDGISPAGNRLMNLLELERRTGDGLFQLVDARQGLRGANLHDGSILLVS